MNEVILEPSAADALARIGRTEDIRFSPDNRRLAIAAFQGNACFLFGVDRSSTDSSIHIHGCLEIRSDAIREPHGIEFVGEDRLLIANRGGGLALFVIPKNISEGGLLQVDALRVIRRAGLFRKLHTPGSLCLVDHRQGSAEILVCNNYAHRISRHLIPLDDASRPGRNSTYLEQGFQIPDGITISEDRAWLAISNHNSHSVLMFDRRRNPRRDSHAVGELLDAGYPHGVRFSPDGRRIYVADAGAPFVHVYERGGEDWQGNHYPRASIRVLDEDAFQSGHVNPEEGGPKGIDLTSSGDLLAITCEQLPLAFFQIAPALSARGSDPVRSGTSARTPSPAPCP